MTNWARYVNIKTSEVNTLRVTLLEGRMIDFSNCLPEQLIDEIRDNPFCIKNLDMDDFGHVTLLEQAVKQEPAIVLLLPASMMTDAIALEAVKFNPLLLDELPQAVRTQEVKLAALKQNPAVVELFTLQDFDTESVKYIYQNYYEMLLDFDDKDIQKKVNEIVLQLKKAGYKSSEETV